MIQKNFSHRIPQFKNDAEAAAFFDTHDSCDYQDDLRRVHLTFPKPKHLLITLKPRQMTTLRHLASRIGKPSEELAQKWITEKLVRLASVK